MLITFVNRILDLEEILKRNVVDIHLGPSLMKKEDGSHYSAIWISMDEISMSLSDGRKYVMRDIIDCACETMDECVELLRAITRHFKIKGNVEFFRYDDYTDYLRGFNQREELAEKSEVTDLIDKIEKED